MKINKIEEVASEPWVYDPVCENPHTYIANGLVNHNCVLWIDEVEKSLSGTKSSNFSDGGTLARVFGTLLTAMQDGMKGVTIIATANDISMLPPEFIRRFNEVFFVDLPGPDERWEIFGIHLNKRNRNLNNFGSHKSALIDASDGFTGAEIEKAVKDAIAAAFYAGKKDVGPKDIITVLKTTKPLSKVMAKQITEMRKQAKAKFRFASSWAEQNINQKNVKTAKGKTLNVNEALDDLPELSSKQVKAAVQENKFSDIVED